MMTMKSIFLAVIFAANLPDIGWAASHQTYSEANRYEVENTISAHPLYQSIVKFSILLDNKSDPKTVWFQDRNLKFHADFLTTLPEFKGLDRKQIDALALKQSGRKVFAGSILETKYSRDNQPTEHHIEILSDDPINASLVRKLRDFVLSRTKGITEKFLYAPVPEQRPFVDANRASFQAAGVSLADLSRGSFSSACYSSGWAIGPVKIVRAQDFSDLWSKGLIDSSDILVMDEVPRELPPFAALIVSSPTSPSSHPALLAEMSQSPFLYQKNATELQQWKTLAQSGDTVILKVDGGIGDDQCRQFVQLASRLSTDEVERLTLLKKPQPIEIRAWRDNGSLPLNLHSVGLKDSLVVGAKAAHVAELTRWIPKSTVTQGLALPISLFARALNEGKVGSTSLRAYVDQRIKIAQKGPPLQTQLALQEIRTAFETAILPTDLVETVINSIEKLFPAKTKIKLRSSSNAEDAKNFNGAGLYDSLGACVGDDRVTNNQSLCGSAAKPKKPKTISAALRGVWGSLYNQKAFLTRSRYSIDEAKVGMGVLVQASFKGELANGVLITGRHQGVDGPALQITITGFPGEDLEVTNPPVGKTPETTRVTNDEIQTVVTSSEIAAGRSLLTTDQYKKLYKLALQVQRQYEQALNLAPNSVSLDMEWKLTDDASGQRIVIKQVRAVPEPALSPANFSTVVVGGAKLRVCTPPNENPEALTKLLLGQGGYLDIAGFALDSNLGPQIPNPIDSFRVSNSQGQLVNFSANGPAKVQASAWQEAGFPDGREIRFLDLDAPLRDVSGNSLSIQWSLQQYRKGAQLFSTLVPFSTSIFRVTGNVLGKDRTWSLRTGLNTETECLADLYNGLIPGFDPEEDFVGRAAPYAADKTFQLSRTQIAVKARSSVQGFDKTKFYYVDEVLIQGLAGKNLSWKNPRATVHAPAHHNFGDEWGFDIAAAEGLTPSDVKELRTLGYRYLILRNGYISNGQELLSLHAVDERGVERLVDEGTAAR